MKAYDDAFPLSVANPAPAEWTPPSKEQLAAEDAKAKAGVGQNQIPPLGQMHRGQWVPQEIAPRRLKRGPAQPPHHPHCTLRRAVAPAPARAPCSGTGARG